MCKSKTKYYKSYNATILEALFLKYKVSKYYLRQCINGSTKGIKPDEIRKDYFIMQKAYNITITDLIEKTKK